MTKPPCKECWDPVADEKEELCDWCKMTPEQRSRRYTRDLILLAVGFFLALCGIAWSLPT